VRYARRLFGGGRLEVRAPLRCGETVERVQRVAGVRPRVGRQGPLVVVTVRSEFSVDGEVRLTEEQDLIYLAERPSGGPAPAAGRAAAAAAAAPWELSLQPDPVLLFRFSALTGNTHRIHYDHAYATEVEGHRGLVVHGPLLALLMLELPRRHAPAAVLGSFEWRALRPQYVDEPVVVEGRPAGSAAELVVSSRDGVPRAQGRAGFDRPLES